MSPVRRRIRSLRSPLLLLVAALALLATACGSRDQAVPTGPPLHGAVPDPPLPVGDQTLPDVTGGQAPTPFAFKAAPGELLAVYFGFTSCPDVCPTTMADLRNALAALPEPLRGKVEVAMVTVDPQRDTPEKLTAYIASFVDRYRALRTEDRAELAEVEQAFAASSSIIPDADGDGYQVSHTATTAVVDDQGNILVLWPFGTRAADMTADLRALFEQVGRRPTSTG